MVENSKLSEQTITELKDVYGELFVKDLSEQIESKFNAYTKKLKDLSENSETAVTKLSTIEYFISSKAVDKKFIDDEVVSKLSSKLDNIKEFIASKTASKNDLEDLVKKHENETTELSNQLNKNKLISLINTALVISLIIISLVL